jgi:hypothetical protein
MSRALPSNCCMQWDIAKVTCAPGAEIRLGALDADKENRPPVGDEIHGHGFSLKTHASP